MTRARPPKCREQARDGVCDHLGPTDPDTTAERGERVAADRVDGQAEHRAPQRDPYDRDDHDEQDECARQPVGHDRADREAPEPIGRRATGCVQDQECNTTPYEQHRQRDDDVGDSTDHDQDAVDGTHEEPDAEHHGDGHDCEAIAGAVHERCSCDARHRHHRADRQVDAAGEHCYRLAGSRKCHGQGRKRQRTHDRLGRMQAG